MARRILVVLFWVIAAGVTLFSGVRGGWALLVPGAVGVGAILFGIDLYRHREIVSFDLELARTFLHVLAAVAVAAACMYWLAELFLFR